MNNKTVVVGMSGGVDSSVAALLLKEQGYNVIGVTMQIWEPAAGNSFAKNSEAGGSATGNPDGRCSGITAVEDAEKIAKQIGIPYYVMDFREEFKRRVMDYFTEEYLAGRTPNPCVVCNRYVKWEALLERSSQLGADYIATGHYARIDTLPNGRRAVRNSVTASKDQTYALYNLTQEQLSKTLFPIGEYTKEKIREIASEAGLAVAGKPDSQDICFVTDDDYAGFIERQAPDRVPPEGNFVDKDGRILGKHKGITHYTIGQRRGLEIAAGHRIFVTDIRPETNEVVIGENEDIFTNEVICSNVNFMSVPGLEPGEKKRVLAKIRYNHKGDYGYIEKLADGNVICRFEKNVRAATPGQAMVFYDGEYVLGGGTIIKQKALAET